MKLIRKTQGNKILSILSIIATILFILSLSLVVLVLYLYVKKVKSESSNQDETRLLRAYCFSPTTNRSTVGIIKRNSHEKQVESKFFKDSNGMYNLISKFDTDEYKCTGSCFCEEKNLRRITSSSHLVRSGLIFLVASVTSLIALEKAKQYFHDECNRLLSHEGECTSPSNMISSKVEDCEPLKKDTTTNHPPQPSKTEEKEGEKEEEKSKVYDYEFSYLCTGMCLPIEAKYFNALADELGKGRESSEIKNMKKVMKKLQKKVQCRKLSLSKSVSSKELNDFFDYVSKSPNVKELDSGKFLSDERRFAKIYFSMLMDDLCSKRGVAPLPGMEDGKGPTFCEAWKGAMGGATFKSNLNPSMKCVKQ